VHHIGLTVLKCVSSLTVAVYRVQKLLTFVFNVVFTFQHLVIYSTYSLAFAVYVYVDFPSSALPAVIINPLWTFDWSFYGLEIAPWIGVCLCKEQKYRHTPTYIYVPSGILTHDSGI
jgi:hypothetical protein